MHYFPKYKVNYIGKIMDDLIFKKLKSAPKCIFLEKKF